MDVNFVSEPAAKQTNRRRIYQLVYERGAISKPEIAALLGISLPTTINNANQLIQEELLSEGEMLGSTGGRKAVSIVCNKNARYSVGVDITLKHVSIVLVNLYGDVINSLRLRMPFANNSTYYQRIGELAADLISKAGVNTDQILGSGISIPGVLSADAQMVIYSHVLGVNALVSSTVGQWLPQPLSLCNDANAAGIAENWRSAKRDVVYLSLSDSVGGSVIMNREIYKGCSQRAGEFGHMTIVKDGLPCYCGRKGCADAYIATHILSRHTDGNLAAFFERVRNGDSYLVPAWDQYVRYLAMVVNNILSAYDCDIILGGYLGEFLEEHVDRLKCMVSDLTTFPGNENYISVCKLQRQAAAIGAALLWVQQFIQTI